TPAGCTGAYAVRSASSRRSREDQSATLTSPVSSASSAPHRPTLHALARRAVVGLGDLGHDVVMPLGLAKALGDLDDAALDAPEDARRREAPARVARARRQPRQDLDALRDRLDGVEVELPRR